MGCVGGGGEVEGGLKRHESGKDAWRMCRYACCRLLLTEVNSLAECGCVVVGG